MKREYFMSPGHQYILYKEGHLYYWFKSSTLRDGRQVWRDTLPKQKGMKDCPFHGLIPLKEDEVFLMVL